MSDRPPERDDLDALLDPLVRFARQQLGKRGAFFHFGAVMKTDAEIVLVAGYTGSEHPTSMDVIDLLRDGMRDQAASGEIRAAGICFDAKIQGDDGQPTDAIVVVLEHRAGDRVEVNMSYQHRRFRGPRFHEMGLGDIDGGRWDPGIFA